VQSAAMGQIPRSKERILVQIYTQLIIALMDQSDTSNFPR